jgi:hypothetical protein
MKIDVSEIYITIEEMCITDTPLTLQEAETLSEYSIYLSGVRKKLGTPLFISRKSGHRPRAYEISKGRTGNSEHSTFHLKGRGAVDLIYSAELLEILKKDTFFTRICYYLNNNFIHADRKPIGGRCYYEAGSVNSTWKIISIL